jgi:hypothetical protein
MSDSANIARHLGLVAARQPQAVALKVPRGRARDGAIDYLALTFRELDAEVGAWCQRLTAAGVRRGDRTLVMVPPRVAADRRRLRLVQPRRRAGRDRPRHGAEELPRLRRRRAAARPGGHSSRPSPQSDRPPAFSLGAGAGGGRPRSHRAAHFHRDPGARGTGSLRLRPARSRRRPLHLRLHRRPQGSVLRTRHVRGPGPAHPRHLRHRARRGRPADAAHLRPLQPRPRHDHRRARNRPAPARRRRPRRDRPGHPARKRSPTPSARPPSGARSPAIVRKTASPCRPFAACSAPVPPFPPIFGLPPRLCCRNGRLHSPYGATEALPIATIASDEVATLAADPSSPARGACLGRALPGIEIRIIAPTDAPLAVALPPPANSPPMRSARSSSAARS